MRSVAVLATQPNNGNDVLNPGTLTPYERMKKLVAARDDRADTAVVDTVEGLKTRLRAQGQNSPGVIRMRFLWVSDHSYKQWKLVQLHLVDANAPGCVEDQLKVFRDRYEAKRQDIDSILLTAAVWGNPKI